MNLQELLQRLHAEVPDCVAVLAMNGGGSVIDARGEDAGASVPAAMHEVFDRSGAMSGDELVPREIVVLSNKRTYVCHRLDDTIVTTVCSTTSNLGLLLGIARREIAAMETTA